MAGGAPRLMLLACLLMCVFAVRANEEAVQDVPLFASHDILDVRIAAPFETDPRNWPADEYVAGVFSYEDENADRVELDVGIRARGRYRRRPDVCSFPPLRLNFKKSQVGDTLLAGQDKLKLVTHCNADSYIYQQTLLSEYLAYRIFNLLTNFSYRVRLLQIEYVNSGNGRSFNEYGILIEHKNGLSQRIGLESLNIEKTPASNLDADHLNLSSIFHYMIGNTDFSPLSGSPGGECCHNHTLFGEMNVPTYSIPYDFDMSGLVNAPHASPNPKLRLESVQERLYRGRCVNNDRIAGTLETFLGKREEIEALIRSQPGVSSRKRRELLGYINEFYRSVSNERRIDRNLIRRCK